MRRICRPPAVRVFDAQQFNALAQRGFDGRLRLCIREDETHAGVRDHPPETRNGESRIERDIRRAGFQHGKQRRDEIEATRK